MFSPTENDRRFYGTDSILIWKLEKYLSETSVYFCHDIPFYIKNAVD
jgi:hypothetical protein